MHKIKLLALILLLSACSKLPPAPAVNQCAYTIQFNKFRCCNTVTKECFNLTREDASMEAAQCLSADDYKAMAQWIESIRLMAEQRCR